MLINANEDNYKKELYFQRSVTDEIILEQGALHVYVPINTHRQCVHSSIVCKGRQNRCSCVCVRTPNMSIVSVELYYRLVCYISELPDKHKLLFVCVKLLT